VNNTVIFIKYNLHATKPLFPIS